MPRNSFRARRYKKTPYNVRIGRKSATVYKRGNKARQARAGTVVGRSLGFPSKMLFKHRYVENLVMTCTAGAISVQNWKCNALYDPNHTGGGHQPMFFDNMCAIYDHYHVIGSRIKLRFTDTDATADSTPLFVGVFINDDVTLPTSNISIMENKLGKWMMTSEDSRQNIYQLNTSYSTKKLQGGGSIMANDQLQGTATSDPTELSFYSVWVQPADGSSTVSIRMVAEIDYIAVWTELKDPDYN